MFFKVGNAIFLTMVLLLGIACAEDAPVQTEIPPSPTIPPALTLPAPPTSIIDVKKPINGEDAVNIALKNQPSIKIAVQGAAAAHARVMQAANNLLPAFQIYTGYSRNKIIPATTDADATQPDAYKSNFTISQLVYDFGKTDELVNQSMFLEESARYEVKRSQADTIYNVKQAYYTLLQHQQLVKVNEATVKDQQAHLDLAKARFDSGMAPMADIVKAQTALADAIQALTQAQNSAVLSKVSLNLAMGIDVLTPIQTVDQPGPQTILDDNLNTLLTMAYNNRPELKQAMANLSAFESNLKVSKTGNLPNLYATGKNEWTSSDFPPRDNIWCAEVDLVWSPFDFSLTKGKIKEAAANLEASKVNVYQANQLVANDVTQAYANFKTSQQRLVTTNAEVANAEENLRLSTGRYESGIATFLEVLDAQTALTNARTNNINALFSLSISRAAIERAVGTTLK